MKNRKVNRWLLVAGLFSLSFVMILKQFVAMQDDVTGFLMGIAIGLTLAAIVIPRIKNAKAQYD